MQGIAGHCRALQAIAIKSFRIVVRFVSDRLRSDYSGNPIEDQENIKVLMLLKDIARHCRALQGTAKQCRADFPEGLKGVTLDFPSDSKGYPEGSPSRAF